LVGADNETLNVAMRISNEDSSLAACTGKANP
jgi:hypothetical protein